jgi:two-component system sensor histidine kinase/response regulator
MTATPLPLDVPPSSNQPSDERPVVTCLLVDDLEENLLALGALLREPGVELLKARSAAEALELLLVHDVALALLDVQMPETDGFELAELMRGMARTRHIPIVFVTAGAREQIRMFQGYDAGAVDFLYKPIDPHVLRSKARVFFDLHRQKLLLAQKVNELSEALRLNELFTAVLGHDLRNPLSAIAASAKVVQKAEGDAVMTGRAAVRIEAVAKRMSSLIEDVLDFSRARLGGGIPLRRTSSDLQDIVRGVVQEHQAVSPEAQIEVKVAGDLRGEWDAERLAQVASNLIGNALSHGGGQSVTVELDGNTGSLVTVAVRNPGVIPPDVLRKLFEPFQSGRSDVRRGQGLGLGLFIVQQIVLAHQGRVDVRTASTEGTTFVVQLPRR